MKKSKTEQSSFPSPVAFTVSQFCKAHGISRGLFYLLLKDGRAPTTMCIGRRRLISAESAHEWRKSMEEKTKRNAS